jgi:hypothetical protein
MSRNGSGVQTSPGSSFPAVAATLIESTKFNNVINDINTVLTQSISNDGQTPVLANLPMGGFKHTGAAAGTSANDYVTIGQLSGLIALWSGSIATIPTGWFICDGANGTPDLRDKFVVGAGATYAVAATGGSKDAVVVSHTHIQDAHGHGILGDVGTSGTAAGIGGAASTGGAYGTTVTSAVAVNQSTGVSGTDANLPPYYSLAYIMKS